MIDKFKKYLKSKLGMSKQSTGGFEKMARSIGVSLRELTFEEMQDVNFENFGRKLQKSKLLPRGFNPLPSHVEIVPTGANEDEVNYVNVVYSSEISDDVLKVNIKDFNVTTAKNNFLIYQYNKGMSNIWMDTCYAYLWAKKAVELRKESLANETEECM